MNPTNFDIYSMELFTKWMPNPWSPSSKNTTEFMIDQIWGALQFPW